MRLKNITKISLTLLGGLTFNYLFWDEKMGVNIFIFSFLMVLIGLLTSNEVRQSKGAWTAIVGVCITGAMVIWHHSFAARFTHITTLVVFLGFLCQPQLKTAFNAIAASVLNALDLPKSIVRSLVTQNEKRGRLRKKWRLVKLIVLPWVIFWIFYLIFYASNPVFASYCDKIWNAIGEILDTIFKDISIPWIAQLVFGMSLIALVVFKSTRSNLQQFEGQLSDTITRRGKKRFHISLYNWNAISLKNEYRSALILIGSINALLFIVNTIDVYWIWFNFEYDPSFNLSQFVHEGTYLLILSILLSMGILLYFFRKNLNFFPNNVWLRRLAIAWILQNAILVVSVIIRNYHYMYHFGLAYKRIGVMFFLTAVIVGLITLFIKISAKKSSFYLLKVNSWAVFTLLIVLSSVNWDTVIARHNIAYTSAANMDEDFLLTLSDKTLPIIDQNRDKLELNLRGYDSGSLEDKLDERIERFMRKQERLSWKSWNYEDAAAYAYFKSKRK